MRTERRSRRTVLRSGPIDLTDAVVVVIVALLVAGILVAGAVVRSHRDAAEPGAARMPVPSPSPTATTAPRIDLIAAGTDATKALAAGLGHPSDVSVSVHSGGGFIPTKGNFADIAASLDPSSSLVIIVPPVTDSSAGAISLVKAVSRTVSAAKKAAPDAEILIAGPAAPAADGAELRSMRDALHGAAMATKVNWIDPITRGWVEAGQVDSTGTVTADGLKAVGKGLGVEASAELAD